REPPARWSIRLADLRSRLVAAPAVAVDAPDDALLGAVLVKLFTDRQLRISEDLIAYLLPRIERSFAAAQAIVAALDQAALADQRAVTVRLARDILSRDRNPDRD
ncbi:MAG TPA: DNA replication protein, partial [Stellaceae bacterium]|nr:DNA replication protein [Stellaceae bacterium]